MKKKSIIILSSVIILLGLLIAAYFLFFKDMLASKVTVTFDSDGGTEVSAMTIKKGEKITLPFITKEGYSFLGWFIEDQAVDNTKTYEKDVTLKAKWKESKKDFTVSFDSKGGNKVSNIIVECDKTLPALPKPTRSGYTFVAWNDKNGKAILEGALLTCENITLYADWKKNEETKKTYTITFDTKGGNKVNSITVTCGNKVPTLPTPKRDGYDFVSWYDKNGKTILAGANLNCENITLYADWKAQKKYTCPDGYTLNGTKCTIETATKEKCPDGTKVDGTLCINTSISNAGSRVCKAWTVSIDGKGHTSTEATGDFYMVGNSSSSYGKCAYHKWTGLTQSQCDQTYQGTSKKVTWVSELGACYAETKIGNYETVCASDYQYYDSSQLSTKFGIHDNGKCLKKVSKVKYCDSPYVLTNNKCVKTIDATLK